MATTPKQNGCYAGCCYRAKQMLLKKMNNNNTQDDNQITFINDLLYVAACGVVEMMSVCRSAEDARGPRANGFTGHEDDHRNENSGPKLLSKSEKLRLDKAEFDFALRLDAIRRIGEPLASIKDQHLYREKFDSFEDYCEKRWALDRATVPDLIGLMSLDDVECLGDLLLPPDHPRADDLSDCLLAGAQRRSGLNDDEIQQQEMQRYLEREGRYRLPPGVSKSDVDTKAITDRLSQVKSTQVD